VLEDRVRDADIDLSIWQERVILERGLPKLARNVPLSRAVSRDFVPRIERE
jgi:hypothetical protein